MLTAKESVSDKVKGLKFMKKVPVVNKLEGFAKKHIGSRDYKNASEMMRKILVETVNKDLSEYAKKITAPTLLMWGDNDTEEPVERAQELEKIMKDAGLIVFPNSFPYISRGILLNSFSPKYSRRCSTPVKVAITC